LYEESQSLDPSATTQARIAQCMEHQGKLASALRAYESALSLADELDPLRKRKASEVFPRSIAALEPRVPKLRITVRTPIDGLRVEIDGRTLGTGTLESPIPLDPGRHTVVARTPKSPPVKCDFEATEGTRTAAQLEAGSAGTEPCRIEGAIVVITLPEPSPETAPTAPPKDSSSVSRKTGLESSRKDDGASKTSGGGSTQRALGWALGGAGLVTLGVSGYFGLRTLSLVSDADCDELSRCSQDGVNTIDRSSDTQTAGFVALGIGAALAGTGLTLLLVSRESSPPEARSGRALFVSATPRGASLGASW
jgi:hypothetical protein